MRHTALYHAHVALGARIVEFSGWDMPIQYSRGVLAEHDAVRRRAGVFDVSHMGRIRIRGENAVESLNHIVTSNILRLRVGRARYGLICNESGGILDDVVVMRLNTDEFLLVCNAASWDRILGWLNGHATGVTITPERDETAMLAVQGPAAADILAPLCGGPIADMGRFACRTVAVAGVDAIVSRTGYTGEDGFEVILPSQDAERVWSTLVREGEAEPCGLAARDVLRLEAGLMLYGQDMDTAVTPPEAGLERFMDMDTDFIGADSIRAHTQSGIAKRLTGLIAPGRSAPRHGYPVRLNDGRESVITSGSYSPSLGRSIALAYLPMDSAMPGVEVEVDIRGRGVRATTAPLPFLQPRRS